MRIALLIETLTGGGAESVVAELAIGLARRGQRAHVYCLRDAGPLRNELAAAGVTVREAHSRGRDLWLAARLARWLLADHIELVNAHSSAALVWALPATKLLGIPVMQTRHGVLLGSRGRYPRLADTLAPMIDKVAIVAESLRARLRPRRLAERAIHLPNGLDRPPIDRANARRALEAVCGRAIDGPVILSVGTLCEEKDTCGLLAAFARLAESQRDATLVCIGGARNAAYAAKVEDALRKWKLAERVVFPGAVADAWRLMAGADVFCLASITEAMPNVIVEAMSQGVPIVATAVGDVGRLSPTDDGTPLRLLKNGETALLVPPGNPEVLAAALHRTLADPDGARRRAARARATYDQRHTAEQMVRRYEAEYQAILRPTTDRDARRSARPRVLMVGPAPGQIGGMSSVIEMLAASPLQERCVLHRHWPPPHSAREDALAQRGAWGRLAARAYAVGRHLGALLTLARTIRRERINIVHIHTCSYVSFYRNVLDLLVTRALGRRAILHIHGGKFEQFCAQRGVFGRWLRRWACETADAVVVLSDGWRQALRPFVGRARIVTVANGVALRPVPERDAERPCRFLFLGALVQQKGVGELLAAAARLHAADVPFELILAGPTGPHEGEDWPRMVGVLGLESCVRFAGPVDGPARDKLLADCDCLVLPSLHEGLPMAMLEAAAAGLPVITTAVGAIPEFMRLDAQPEPDEAPSLVALLAPGDTPALALQMARLARNGQLRRELGQRLRARVRARYSDVAVARRLAAVYQRVLHGVRGGAADKGAAWSWLARNVTYPLHEFVRGRRTLREYHELLGLAVLTPAELQRRCNDRLTALLRFAQTHLPHYAEQCTTHGVNGQAADVAGEVRKLPVLAKADVRAHAERMIWHDVPGGPVRASSGGSTGDTLYFHVDRVRQAQDLAARLFMQGRFGVRPGDRRLHLWGSPIESRRAWVARWRDRLINELLIDAFDMSPARMEQHLRTLQRYRPRVLYGYTTALTRLAQHAAARHGPADFPWLKLAVLTGEEVAPDHVAQVRRTFGCPVAAEYGNREVGLIAHECPRGRMHIIAPHVFVEIVRDDGAAPVGEAGEIVCTHLGNRAQPLLRYRVGDVGRLLGEPCPCGLPFPTMRVEGGKLAGFLALPDGRLCHGAVSSHALKDLPGIVAWRTHQRALDHIEILLVVNSEFPADGSDRIQARYRRLFGDQVRVECRFVDQIPPDPSGKRRHVVSDVAPNYSDFRLVTLPSE